MGFHQKPGRIDPNRGLFRYTLFFPSTFFFDVTFFLVKKSNQKRTRKSNPRLSRKALAGPADFHSSARPKKNGEQVEGDEFPPSPEGAASDAELQITPRWGTGKSDPRLTHEACAGLADFPFLCAID